MVKELTIKNAAQIERISRLAWDAPCEIYLHIGSIELDARDLTPSNMYDLVGKGVRVVAGDNADPTLFGYLVEQMEGMPKFRHTLRQQIDSLIDQVEPRYGWETRLVHMQR